MCDFCVCVTDRKMSDVCLHVLLREKEREKHVSYILALLCEYKNASLVLGVIGGKRLSCIVYGIIQWGKLHK